jgi:two-component system phosphate regulon sensor histidine kinase PhoR
MTKRIFRSICIVAISVFLASVVLFMGVLYEYFSNVQRNQLKMQTELAAQGVADEGLAYFEGLSISNYRITWIDTDGTVIYDSKSDSTEMENHLEREEIKQALAEGIGESSRYSVTLMERSLYCAKRLNDGTVLRLSIAQNTILTLILGMAQPICIIFLIAMILSLVLANSLSKKIVKPLNELNLDEPMKNEDYDELTPLLRRIESQQRQIRIQSDELEQKKKEFETVTNGMAEGIILLNSKRTILSINPAAKRLFGADYSCIGKYILSVNRSLELQSLLLKAGDGQYAEMVMELGGSKYQLDASPVISDGQVSGTVLLMLDVTEKEKSEQMRREFTANVSHELKTPLHTISGCAELLSNGMVKPEDITGFSTQIYTEAQRMIRLVEDIIRLSHLDEGATDMKREDVDLYALSEETIQILSQEADEAKIQMNLEGEKAVIYGIPQLLQGIIYNLCDNAIKYNREGGSVIVSVKNEEHQVQLSVVDTGIGIPVEHQERIFERFYRVDKSHSKEIGGTGLGLSIVKHAARLHDASINVHSVVDGGTTIVVSFPKK